MYTEGKAVREVADHYGVTRQTIRTWLKNEGVGYRRKSPPTLGRLHGKGTSKFVVYTVYHKKGDDLPIIVDGYAQECAALMGIQVGSFWSIVCKQNSEKYRTSKKWHVECRFLNGKHRDDLEDEDDAEE